MANRWPGGLIRKTPVTPTTSAAPGFGRWPKLRIGLSRGCGPDRHTLPAILLLLVVVVAERTMVVVAGPVATSQVLRH